MASIISVDNIRATGTSTNAITIDSSNNLGDITMNAEGGTGTLSVRQGVAKAWINFNGTGTPATRDSLNASSLTDDSTGKFTLTFSSAMDNDDFAAVTSGGSSGTSAMMGYMYSPATSSVKLEYVSASNALADPVFGTSDVNGDLA